MGEFDNKEREEVFSKKVRAGKRTYFFDVKATRSGDFYLTLTESKKRLEDGVFVKHKIFLYKEDFEKFAEGLNETVDYIKTHQDVVEKRYEFSENEEYSHSPKSIVTIFLFKKLIIQKPLIGGFLFDQLPDQHGQDWLCSTRTRLQFDGAYARWHKQNML